MFGTKRLVTSIAGVALGIAGLVAASGSASAAVLTIEEVGLNTPGAPADTKVERVDLAAAGLTSINTIILTDITVPLDNPPTMPGSPGIFTGYDLDAVFLDVDGDLTTSGDRFYLTGTSFTGGTIWDTDATNQMPSAVNDYGTYFGTNDAGNIAEFGNSQDATLDTFDGVNSASRLNADGYLSLGQGGELVLTFADILVGDSLYLMFGEVAGQGEALQVSTPSAVPLPGAVWLFLSAIAVLFGMSRRRNAITA
jgi:hypothetical protein